MSQSPQKQNNTKARSITARDFGIIRYRIRNQHIKKKQKRKLKDKIIKNMRQIWKQNFLK